ncbi:MAG: T9SS type A sorting domain-containing protein [Candidatus Marinimicrobia bacterium]|nr:T9SS type A sorting domain-containing protein [Candidatus Neomarinimicrobiota bacterium]
MRIEYLNVADNDRGVVPTDYTLEQNYPNPFNPETVIEYALPKASDISLVIYNLRGQEVRRWDIQGQPAGNHRVSWDAQNIASGVYLYRLIAGPPAG